MIRQQYATILERVAEVAVRAGRSPGDIRVMAVTKTQTVDDIREAIAAGATLLGENRVQELREKRPQLLNCEMHLIGHLQSNKAARAVACADMVQSVDSVRIAREISKECLKQNKAMPILLEVNIGREPQKFGFLPEQLDEAAGEIAAIPGIILRGLMAVPPIFCDKTLTQQFFSRMKQLYIDIQAKKRDNNTVCMDTLSMGMSDDYELAVAEGSTLVRVGSAIFGGRQMR